MVEFMSFDSADEMVEWMATQRERVQQRELSEEQKSITFGSHAIRFMEGLLIFVQVPTLEEQAAIEDAEFIDLLKRKERSEDMLWCKCFSTFVGDGEFGYLHRSVLWPITERTFNMARAVHWSADRLLPVSGEAMLEVQTAYYALRRWTDAAAERAEGDAYLNSGAGAPITEAEAAYFRDKDQS